mgnify:CR=1 FL=1
MTNRDIIPIPPSEGETGCCKNTDRELYREPTDQIGTEYYQPSIHVTERGSIGINVGGYVIVMPLRNWHAIAKAAHSLADMGIKARPADEGNTAPSPSAADSEQNKLARAIKATAADPFPFKSGA